MLQVAFVLATVTTAATPSPPPTIYHVISRPLCSELREHIKPAIGMMMENDGIIRKSPQLLAQYNTAALQGSQPSASGVAGAGDPGSNASQNMALLGLENLIRPIANNIIAIETALDSPALLNGTGRAEDDQHLQAIRDRLLKALAAQNASLDIISGFVDTQQMADLQHADEGYINSLNQTDVSGASSASPAPNPLTSNPGYAGLPPNPYDLNLATVPGLTLGYNPVTRLIVAMHWTIDQTATRENDAAKAVMDSASLCSYVPLAQPSPAPTP